MKKQPPIKPERSPVYDYFFQQMKSPKRSLSFISQTIREAPKAINRFALKFILRRDRKKGKALVEKERQNEKHIILLVLLAALALTSCVSADAGFIASNAEAAELFGSELIGYIQADEKITEYHKTARVRSVQAWVESCRRANEAHKEQSE